MTTALFILVILQVFIVVNVLRKLEMQEVQTDELEQRLLDTYGMISVTLHTMRTLDERRMFEDDDEVGVVFQELVTVVNNLRPFIYESVNDDTQTED
jgi:hypothetical protein